MFVDLEISARHEEEMEVQFQKQAADERKRKSEAQRQINKRNDMVVRLIKSKSCLMEKSTVPKGEVVEKSEGNFIMYKF